MRASQKVTAWQRIPPLLLYSTYGGRTNRATAGLQHLAAEVAAGEFMLLGDQWDGLRRYARPALVVWLLSVVGTAVIFANILVYGHLGRIAGWLRFLWFYVLGFWIAMHVYIYLLLMAQGRLRPFAVYRDAYVLAAGRPAAAVLFVFAWLLLLLLASISGLLVVIGLGLFAVIQQNAALAVKRSFEGAKVPP